MASEFTPPGQGAKMTRAQVRKYIRDMEEKREQAKKKLKELQKSGELEQEQKELDMLEAEIDRLNGIEEEYSFLDTSLWKFLTPDDFFEKYDLYKKLFGFAIGAPKLKTIFIEEVVGELKQIVEDLYQKQGEVTRNILWSKEYPDYIYVETELEHIIKIT